MSEIYFSYSSLSTINSCARKYLFNSDPKTYKPYKRSISLVKGSIVHEVINTLIGNPDYDPKNEFIAAFNLEASDSEIPIDFGSKGRDVHVQEGIEMVEAFWNINGPDSPNPMDFRASERWFFFPIKLDDGTDVWIRGRLDGIIAVDGGVFLDDWKSGAMEPNPDELKFNPQMLGQIIGWRYGYVTVEDDLAYIGPSDDAYHIHDFQPISGKQDHYMCTKCQLVTRKFGVYPKGAMIYHVKNLVPTVKERAARWEVFQPVWHIHDEPQFSDKINCPKCLKEINIDILDSRKSMDWRGYQYDKPGWKCPSCKCRIERRLKKTRSKKPEMQNQPEWVYKVGPDIPRGNPEFKIDFDEEKIEAAFTWLRESIQLTMACRKSNIYPQTQNVGFGSPCTSMSGCEFINHCENKEMCSVSHDSESVFDIETYKWVKLDE